jgi:hypothetical protein
MSITNMWAKITAHNAGWRLPPSSRLWRTEQFRFAGGVYWSGVCAFGCMSAVFLNRRQRRERRGI